MRGALRRLGLAAVIAAILLSVGGVRPALAHALLERASPGPEELLRTAPRLVYLWFSEDLNVPASKIIVWNRYRQVENIGSAHLVPGQTRQLEVGLKPLSPGAYLVLWTSVSAADGHVLRGAYLFYVKKRGPGPSLAGVATGGSAQTFPDGPTLTSIVSHGLELLAAVVWVGAEAFFFFVLAPITTRLEAVVLRREERRRVGLLRFSLVLLVLSSAMVMLMLAYGLAGGWGDAFSSSTWSQLFVAQYGKLWIARQGLALLALALTIAPRTRPALSPSLAAAAAPVSRSRPMPLVGLGVGAIYLYLFAASGHAASANVAVIANSHMLTGAVVVDWLHYIADALWLGGQFYILAVLMPALALRRRLAEGLVAPFLDTLNRFSPFAYVSVALFTLSGVFNAYIHVPGFYAFFNSVYGKTLIIKIILIGMMMSVSVLTVYFIRPRLRHMLASGRGGQPEFVPLLRALLFFLRVNPALGAGVLLATSVMFYYPVPFGFGPPGPSSYTAQHAGLIATISLDPDHSGPNQIRVNLTDTRHRPISQAHIAVLSTMLDMPMGTGIAPLTEKQPGVFGGPVELGMGGHWRILLLIYQPNGLSQLSVDVRVGL